MMRKGETHPMNQPISAREKLMEVQREISMRRTVYEKAVREGRMTAPEAARKIGIMMAIAEDYRGMQGMPLREAASDEAEA